jgi:hypothetical protein
MQNKQWRRWLILTCCILVFIGMLALIFYPKPYYALKGRLRGEAFFDGYPTSYYRELIVQDDNRGIRGFLQKFGIRIEVDPLEKVMLFELRRGDAKAMPVVLELLRDPEPEVQSVAIDAIEHILRDKLANRSLPAMRQTIPLLEKLLEKPVETNHLRELLQMSASHLILEIDPDHAKARAVKDEFASKYPRAQ